ncbi:hypothetical protein FE257_005933 [Aspergillus nanangensis]|uniref:Uncharacterized protein n=1 Tax=Aspergillus nanangensis TaxID=2582783 RepID=A0AAD4CQG5_ASPNN|nr:hypothetical protein FE257_005933 [Aspergillus nanangensis]
MAGMTDGTSLPKAIPFELSEADLEALATKDEDFVPHNWEDLKEVIARGDMSLLKRSPTDLRNYIRWRAEIQTKFGSVTNFILRNKLHWASHANNHQNRGYYGNKAPLTNSADFRILRNDWPYGMSSGILHLLVWSKTPIPVNGDGDPTPESRRLILQFIERTFGAEMNTRDQPRDNILWFKNRKRWQSVQALEHIHIMLRNADEGFITRLTGQYPEDLECSMYSSAAIITA